MLNSPFEFVKVPRSESFTLTVTAGTVSFVALLCTVPVIVTCAIAGMLKRHANKKADKKQQLFFINREF